MIVERVNPCVRPLALIIVSVATTSLRPRFFPRERLVCFRYKGGLGEQPFLDRDYHTTAEFHHDELTIDIVITMLAHYNFP